MVALSHRRVLRVSDGKFEGVRSRQQTARLAATGALAGLLALTTLAGASSNTQKAGAKLTIQIERETGQDTLFGKVGKTKGVCKKKRKVRLFHRAVGERNEAAVQATLKTDSKGEWTHKAKKNENGARYTAPGYYHTKVGQVRRRSGDKTIICKQRDSRSIFIG